MTQVVSLRSLTADAPVGTWLCPSNVRGGRSGHGTDFCSTTSVFPGSEIPPMPQLIFIYMLLINIITNELSLGTFKKAVYFQKWRSAALKSVNPFFCSLTFWRRNCYFYFSTPVYKM